MFENISLRIRIIYIVLTIFILLFAYVKMRACEPDGKWNSRTNTVDKLCTARSQQALVSGMPCVALVHVPAGFSQQAKCIDGGVRKGSCPSIACGA